MHLLKEAVKFGHLAMRYIVHYTVQSHNQGGYYNSHILQALELPPWAQSPSNFGSNVKVVDVLDCSTPHPKSVDCRTILR